MNTVRIARKSIKDKKIGIAMSGGVDSSATALLLRDHYEVQGFFMRLKQPDFEQQLERVTHLADRLDIKLNVIDLRIPFKEKVLDYFSSSYFEGLTPNPCMVCNRKIKFGLFQDAIIEAGMDIMATGHYAVIKEDEKNDQLFHLHEGLDYSKDQSYFLARLGQKQLQRAFFPLGEMHKKDIYTFVKKHGFTDFEGKESQDVCFLGDEPVSHYLAEGFPEAIVPGDIVSTDGKKLGTHNGLFRYTIGQRRGLGIPDETPWYVYRMETASNKLIVCKNDELNRHRIDLKGVHWTSGVQPLLEKEYKVRIRYSHRGAMARLTLNDDGLTLDFEEPQRAVTPGQFAVIYNDTEVVGSGIII